MFLAYVFYNSTFLAFIGNYKPSNPAIVQDVDPNYYTLKWTPHYFTDGTLYQVRFVESPPTIDRFSGLQCRMNRPCPSQVLIANPDTEPSRSQGFSDVFEIQYPYVFETGDWGTCQTPFGTLCGGGTQRRPLYCLDIVHGLVSSVVNNKTVYSYGLVDVSNCGPYGTTPVILQR